MKKYILALIALLSIQFALCAQNEQETQTLFNSLKFSKIGFMVLPYCQISQIDKVGVSNLGLRSGILLNDKLSIGGFYSLSVNEIVPKSETDLSVYMDYRAWGGFIEYTLWSTKLVHLTFPLLIGGGEVEMDKRDNYSDSNQNPYGEKMFFILEPSVFFEINLHRFVRFDAGISYRIVNDMTYRNFNQSSLIGFTGTIGLKIGVFKRNLK
jgi:hypothetical protein